MDETRRHNLMYPTFTFCYLYLNKIKIFLSVIWLSVQCKNTPKIKVLQMPWNLNMIFSRIFENIWHWEHTRGCTSEQKGRRARPTPLGAPPVSWAPGGSPPLMPAPTHFIFYPKKSHPSQARVLARFAAIFDLLAQSSIHKTVLGVCCLVCDFSIGPISFCFSALFIANFCCIGDHILELAC